MTNISIKRDSVFTNNIFLFWAGFVLTFALTLSEVVRGRQMNFFIFLDATKDFWNGIIPYGSEWASVKGHDVFLYGPLFNLLFSPFMYMPGWLSPFAWNLINFTLYYLAVFSLPDKFCQRAKCSLFLYSLPILATTQLSFQYNVVVTYVFLFSFSLLERGKYLWAISLILLSAFTKIYGVFQLGMLIFYPGLRKNISYMAMVSLLYLFLPLVKIPLSELCGYYMTWFEALAQHDASRTYHTLFYLKPFFSEPPSWITVAQISSITLLALMLIINRSKYVYFSFRTQSLGILMGWVILFGTSSEYHTYVIALVGYMLWYYSRKPSLIDKILYWSNLIVLAIMPIDIFCPAPVYRFFFITTTINIWIFAITWTRMVICTFFSSQRLFESNISKCNRFK